MMATSDGQYDARDISLVDIPCITSAKAFKVELEPEGGLRFDIDHRRIGYTRHTDLYRRRQHEYAPARSERHIYSD